MGRSSFFPLARYCIRCIPGTEAKGSDHRLWRSAPTGLQTARASSVDCQSCRARRRTGPTTHTGNSWLAAGAAAKRRLLLQCGFSRPAWPSSSCWSRGSRPVTKPARSPVPTPFPRRGGTDLSARWPGLGRTRQSAMSPGRRRGRAPRAAQACLRRIAPCKAAGEPCPVSGDLRHRERVSWPPPRGWFGRKSHRGSSSRCERVIPSPIVLSGKKSQSPPSSTLASPRLPPACGPNP
jgi:hypothetical protein